MTASNGENPGPMYCNYTPAPRVGYFTMEIAIDPRLRTYAGGLGYLAGSHARSAWQLGLPLVAVSILWRMGYGEQSLDDEGNVALTMTRHDAPFLRRVESVVEVSVFSETVRVGACKIDPEVFGAAPVYLLTTDLPDNPPHLRALTDRLYDADPRTRIAQEMILGIGGLRMLRAEGESIDVLHINEGHGLSALFERLSERRQDLDAVRRDAVFTTHTPIAAGNETHALPLLADAGYFVDTPPETALALGGDPFSLTAAALRMCRLANAVSQAHGRVANALWNHVDGRCPIIAITNSVDLEYWQDPRIAAARAPGDLLEVKRQMKRELFESVFYETGRHFHLDVLTLVWARRFAEYKRPLLPFRDLKRLGKLLADQKIQLIFAGKFHPADEAGRMLFNRTLAYARELPNLAVMLNYDLALSQKLKRGADVWLNTPLRPLEASGTSGMSANMNGALHLSSLDGWAAEGTFHGINGFIFNPEPYREFHSQEFSPSSERREAQDAADHEALMTLLESEVIPCYYQDRPRWARMMRRAILAGDCYFHSERMVMEYYNRLYDPIFQ